MYKCLNRVVEKYSLKLVGNDHFQLVWIVALAMSRTANFYICREICIITRSLYNYSIILHNTRTIKYITLHIIKEQVLIVLDLLLSSGLLSC